MTDPDLLLVAVLVFVCAGIVKGLVGLGMPTIGLAALTLASDLHTAMALVLVPAFASNARQALRGGQARTILRRLWPYLIAAVALVPLGATALTRVDMDLLSGLLGLLLVVYAGSALAGWRPVLARRHERWTAPLVGGINGILTGMTGAFLVPCVIYLQAIQLPRDQLIQAMGILFLSATITLGLTLGGNHLLSTDLALLSVLAVIPAFAGMRLGEGLRRRLSEARFRQVLLTALLLVGLYLMARAAWTLV
ncbi:sulfite exporter TauE/SafE family protein [Rhodovibrio salinarum]|uniref:Probable membrane transporter protein n=1 Tax=Rhodovibrio salinarum TaxID=1087 RepID=A0A934QKD7_9PROT|nr:sulfite exporter TauE/SafE family protein [Rhodovibrio salinarum]MBK1698135.1 sulfite exporter TauE/SafE family protein [Rhodovibrio salinarum]